MNEIAVNLSIVLPGSTMWSEEECLKTTQENEETIDKTKVERHHMKMLDRKSKKQETVSFYTRKYRPAMQSININKDAFKYMTSRECPSFASPSKWVKLKPMERLEAHLKKITEHLGGTSYTYQVFGD